MPWAAAYKSLGMKSILCLRALLPLLCSPTAVTAAEFSNLVSFKMCQAYEGIKKRTFYALGIRGKLLHTGYRDWTPCSLSWVCTAARLAQHSQGPLSPVTAHAQPVLNCRTSSLGLSPFFYGAPKRDFPKVLV